VIGVEEVKRLNMSSCIVEDREQLLEEFRKKGEYDIIIMKYLLKGGHIRAALLKFLENTGLIKCIWVFLFLFGVLFIFFLVNKQK